jgi:hypothetical protein
VIKKQTHKKHKAHYHSFIFIHSGWITSQPRFQVTNKLIKYSSLCTWTKLEKYSKCKQNVKS